MADKLNRNEYVRAVLATAGDASFEPVHVQKLFFLLDERLAKRMGGRYFHFQPYDYGPFDKEVYDALGNLHVTGDVQVDVDWRGLRHYCLTPAGLDRGKRDLAKLSKALQAEIQRHTEWVRAQSFATLVSTIYKFYPHMRANSVFVDS